jgi:hypothetical protein
VASCDAADVVFAQHLRLHQPAIASDVYAPSLHLASDDGAVYASSLAAICENGWGSELDEHLRASSFGLGLDLDFSFRALCNDPCRCRADIPEAVGCGVHATYARSTHEHDPDPTRPFCYVAVPEMCQNAAVGTDGRAWAYCSVEHDTCQAYNGRGSCSPFVQEGVDVFVPGGTTLDSLQFISAENAVDDWLWNADNAGGNSNILQAWLFEAALVSPGAYAAHGQLVCNSRLRRCREQTQPQPLLLCETDCITSFAAKFAHGSVSNDLLREFDGVTFGDLIQADVVCGWRLLPKGFLVNASVNGLDFPNSIRLQSILSIDYLLASPSVSGREASFGQHVYTTPEENENVEILNVRGKCFGLTSSAGNVAEDSTGSRTGFNGGLDITKALSEIECPAQFIKNAGASAGGAPAPGKQFCVGTCPSNALVPDEYQLLWYLHVVPGILACAVNTAALASWVFTRKAAHSARGPARKLTTITLVGFAALNGLLGVLPVALLQDDLVCDCESEICFSSGLLCKLNQVSVYLVMACCFIFLQKFAVLLVQLRSPWTHVWKSKVDNAWASSLACLVPCVLAAISFGVEEHDNERFHLARAGFRCQFRYRSFRDEALLQHIPMGVCMVLMVRFVVANTWLCFEAMRQGSLNRSFRSLAIILKRRPQMAKMLFNSVVSALLLIFWLSQGRSAHQIHYTHFQIYIDFKLARFSLKSISPCTFN